MLYQSESVLCLTHGLNRSDSQWIMLSCYSSSAKRILNQIINKLNLWVEIESWQQFRMIFTFTCKSEALTCHISANQIQQKHFSEVIQEFFDFSKWIQVSNTSYSNTPLLTELVVPQGHGWICIQKKTTAQLERFFGKTIKQHRKSFEITSTKHFHHESLISFQWHIHTTITSKHDGFHNPGIKWLVKISVPLVAG